ncbi:MAG: AmmeMemoRadiSam system radical SAM enzyme [Phycisphaeraceae bacterium]
MYFAEKWWHTDADSGKVVCTLCPRECHIPEGGRGFCFVRANVEGKLALTTYGRSSGFCIDPIEKKPLNHFLPGTPVLSLGTAGCNLGCKFCQNWDISKSREMDTLAADATPEAIVAAAKKTGCRSIAFTYNDPTIWAEYAIDIAKVARQEGIKTVAVTAGYISPDARREFYQWMDAANVDLKAFTETFYRKLCQTSLQPVLDTIRYLKHETGVWQELTNLMIPGENDSHEETRAMCRWILDNVGDEVPIHFSAFHPDFKMMDKPRTPHRTLSEARSIAMEEGIKYAYVGNVHDKAGDSTYCPSCRKVVIERDWYELGEYHMVDYGCEYCGTKIPGVFDDKPGDWGRKRLPITIKASSYV